MALPTKPKDPAAAQVAAAGSSPAPAVPWRNPDPVTVPDPDPPAAQADPPKLRTVMLYSWWRNKTNTRHFAVVEKTTKGLGNDFRTIGVKMLEVGDSNPFYIEIDKFWDRVDHGTLYEMIPE